LTVAAPEAPAAPGERRVRTPRPDGPAASRATGGDGDADRDEAVFDELRAIRKRIADQKDVPAYVIFPDTTLRAMARDLPETLSDLRRIPGVGDKKLADYGEAFLAALAEIRARETGDPSA
jgi:ATP-dependent DNA helicase RecQ